MRASRLVLLLLVVGAILFLVKNYSGLLGKGSGAASETASPIERAKALRNEANRKAAEQDSAQREADKAPAAGVTENMTLDQVRSMLGPPDEIETGTAESGRSQETWTYKSVGKKVVFENGIVVSIR